MSPIALKRNFDRVTGGARHIEGNYALLTQQRIDQSGFSDIRTTDNCNFDATDFRLFFINNRLICQRNIE